MRLNRATFQQESAEGHAKANKSVDVNTNANLKANLEADLLAKAVLVRPAP